MRDLTTLAVVAASAIVSACAPGPVRVMLPAAGSRAAVPGTIRVQVREGTGLVIRTVALDEYVGATALSELHPDSSDAGVAERMFELQSVIARTYAVTNRDRHGTNGFDLCSTTHCQLYEPARLRSSRWAPVARAAARRTAGEILWFGGGPARVLFHADCGGHTSSAAAVWGGLAPAYLSGAADDGPACNAHREWSFETRAAALRTALNADARTAIGATLERIEVAGRDPSGRAEKILLRGTRTFVIRGEVFREVVTRALGARTLRSTLFTIKQSGGVFVFAGTGFGHGVGLCQSGALARVKAGASLDDVLEHYFPGASLNR